MLKTFSMQLETEAVGSTIPLNCAESCLAEREKETWCITVFVFHTI